MLSLLLNNTAVFWIFSPAFQEVFFGLRCCYGLCCSTDRHSLLEEVVAFCSLSMSLEEKRVPDKWCWRQQRAFVAHVVVIPSSVGGSIAKHVGLCHVLRFYSAHLPGFVGCLSCCGREKKGAERNTALKKIGAKSLCPEGLLLTYFGLVAQACRC